MRTTASLLLVVGLSLSACNSEPEPADVPTPTDSLTTDTESETGPETQSPTSDDVSATSEPATNSPPDDDTTTTSPPDDEATTSRAAGIPELPDEAMEDSEAGAEAFALHYIDLINATGIEPETGVLETLGADGCESCDNYEETITRSAEEGEFLRGDIFDVGETVSLHSPSDSTANVRVAINQIEQDTYDADGEVVTNVPADSTTLVFSLSYQDGWLVNEVRAEGK